MSAADRKLLYALVAVVASIWGAFVLSRFSLTWTDPVGSILTIIAAFIGGYFITRQTRSSEENNRRERTAKYMAARAAMPLVLSSVTEYAVQCSEALARIHSATGTLRTVPRTLPGHTGFPLVAADIVSDFRTLIEFGPAAIGSEIATLLSLMQVQRARLRDLEKWLAPGPDPTLLMLPGNVEEYIIDTAEIYDRAAALFGFARFRDKAPRLINANTIETALDQLDYSIAMQSDLYARAKNWLPHFDVTLT